MSNVNGRGYKSTLLQVSVSETCQAAAYQQADLRHLISQLVSQQEQQRYGTGYGLMGDMQISFANTSNYEQQSGNSDSERQCCQPMGLSGRKGKSRQQQISQHIAGKSKQQALSMLSHLDGIRDVALSLVGGYNDFLPQDAGRIQIIVIYRFV